MKKKSLVLTGKQQLEWRVKTIPPMKEDEILIKTMAGAISIGAELPQYDECDLTEPAPSYPKETGYESYGEVIGVGDGVEKIKAGDRVVAFYGHSDYGIVKAAKVIPVPEEMPSADALLIILSCDAGKGALKLNPSKDETVLISGGGTMGLLTLHFLKEHLGVTKIDVIEPDRNRGRLAKSFGAHTVFLNGDEIPGDHYDYGVECSGRNDAFHTLQKAMKHEGAICILSDGNKETFTLHPDFYRKELKAVGSSDGWDYHRHAAWYADAVKRSDGGLRSIFEKVISSHELISCFEELSSGKRNPVKVLVEY
ncbi:zinc-dependent alcohol dehydrogenase [Bacillus sp. KH172YL63]|uniref:zinc-dependent alcohol dehydrogenase n=1 Tax=Bacillus sp. KH172YL63 TaxID=2709784 RepID=UPI001566BB4C|nr:zinc-binding alcohol dehydrogenase [Bacillus sp. KH172YL63]